MSMGSYLKVNRGLMQIGQDLSKVLEGIQEMESIEGDSINLLLDFVEKSVVEIRDTINEKCK